MYSVYVNINFEVYMSALPHNIEKYQDGIESTIILRLWILLNETT